MFTTSKCGVSNFGTFFLLSSNVSINYFIANISYIGINYVTENNLDYKYIAKENIFICILSVKFFSVALFTDVTNIKKEKEKFFLRAEGGGVRA